MDDEQQRDARAAALLGWRVIPFDQTRRDRNGVRAALSWPHVTSDADGTLRLWREPETNAELWQPGKDADQARELVAALPPEARERFGAILLSRLGFAPLGDVMALVGGADVWRLLNEATPAQVRDACLEALL